MKLKSLLLLITISILSGCEKLSEIATFNVNAQTNIQVNSGTLLNTPIEINTPGITTNSSEEYKNNRTNSSLIKKVVLNELKLTITSPDKKTFSFLKSIYVYISTDNNAEVKLAYLENIPADTNVITLVTTEENLDKFIKASSYTLRTSIETKETLTQPTDIQVDMNFKVTAGIL